MLCLLLFCLIQSVSPSYKLNNTYQGTNFFNQFNFETHDDYNSGTYVDYKNESYCLQNGLINSTSSQVYIGVDHTNTMIVPDRGRPSVRIESKVTYSEGLLIADIEHMPQGCGIWPAYWIYGPYWPNHGEVDIIEMIDLSIYNQISFHTNSSCSYNYSNPKQYTNCTGKWGGKNGQTEYCSSNGATGCSYRSNNNASFGIPFNQAKGGYVAFEWIAKENGGFYTWFWNRNDPNLPKNVLSNTPDPSTWGEPVAAFLFGNWCPYNMFYDNVLTINTDFCGWASQDFTKDCPNTGAYNCVNYVAENPHEFVDAYWIFNSIKYFIES